MSSPTFRSPLGNPSKSRRLRLIGAFALAAALLLPISLLFWQFWSSTGERLDFTAREQAGVAYLRPLVQLLAAVDDAQAAAARGQAVPTLDVRSALAEVDKVDGTTGSVLGLQQRWSEVRGKIDTTLSQTLAAREPAISAYAEPIESIRAMLTKLGDETNLILDPELDSYYLMDAALVRLPEIVVDAGRVADFETLAGADQAPGGAPAPDVVRVAVIRDRVAAGASAVNRGLRTSAESTASPTLAQRLLAQLDEFNASATKIAPSTALGLPPASRPDPATTLVNRIELRKNALALGTASMDELDALLTARATGLGWQRTVAVVAIIVGAVVAGGILFLRLPKREAPEELDAPPTPVQPIPVEPSIPPRAEGPDAESFELVDARELLASSELVHVGRALRPRRPGRIDEPQ